METGIRDLELLVQVPEGAIPLDLVQQDPVGHDLDTRAQVRAVLETHLESDDVGDARSLLAGDELGNGNCRYAPRLGDPDHSSAGVSRLQEDLGDLGGFARSFYSFKRDKHNYISN